MKIRLLALVATIAFLAAIAGVFVGRHIFVPPVGAAVELHDVVHGELHLDAFQERQIDGLEQRFAVHRRALELDMRAANARLADAIEGEHGYGPRVSAAVDQSHRAMGELQKATLAHVFAMRQLLRPDQAKTFDRAVVHALTDDAR